VFPFKKKSLPLLGVDISATAVKLLELTRNGNSYRVESYAAEALPTNSVVDKNIAEIEQVGEVIARALKKSGSKIKTAAAAVAGSSVITKVIEMPVDLTDSEMESQIQIEADQYIPFPLEEVALDFEVIGINENNPDRVDVMLAASRVDNVEGRVGAMELGGLTTKVVDIEAFALENAVKMIVEQQLGEGEGKVIAVADIGSFITTFSVFLNHKIVYSREQQFGGAQLTEEIQRRYGLSYEEAGLAKKQGGLPENYIPEVLDPFKENMSQQISRAQQFFFSSSQIAQIDHLILAGGCASIEGIAEVIQERLSVPTIVANPFANMSLSAKVPAQTLANDAPALMVSCGLALRSFD
jgi:type IV pilus assembly protein PilM